MYITRHAAIICRQGSRFERNGTFYQSCVVVERQGAGPIPEWDKDSLSTETCGPFARYIFGELTF